ncbi:MAG: competence/damage-inducible protein A [Bacteroidales bacterium]|jgi:nicotinamide-nucleotide amidase|nr:competence/damage-inducible protein A [Bacteroidales bacterium]
MDQDKFIEAGIINIGDEILIGQIQNTNASFIAQSLTSIGVHVKKIMVVGDEKESILSAFEEMLTSCNIVIVTGGLGTTNDDMTKDCICKYFHRELMENKSVLNYLQSVIHARSRTIPNTVLKQAMLPVGSEAIANEIGFAPGIWMEYEEKILVAIPGVPQEMQAMLLKVLEKIEIHYHINQHIIHKHIQTFGISEALLSENLSVFEKNLPPCIRLAYLPKAGYVSLRLTGYSSSMQKLEAELEKQISHLSHYVGEYIFSYENKILPELIADKLKERKQTLAVAESCTGGYIAHSITLLSGSSNYFKGGIVAYSNEIKCNVLGVEQQLINQQGAVSEEVVMQMAKNVLQLYNVEYAIAVSGIAGPDGGSVEKPVGTVWIAVADKNNVHAKCFSFGNGRERVIRQSATAALYMLYKLLTSIKNNNNREVGK